MASSAKEERREEQVVSFVAHALVTVMGATMGQRLPEEEDVRNLVRVARVMYDEVDHPTEAGPREEAETQQPPTGAAGMEELFSRHFGLDFGRD
jgi:hypothetical protein